MAEESASWSKSNKELTASQLNTQIVTMRSKVVSARVRLCKRLIKDANSLRNKKAKTDEEKAKNQRKADRFIEELPFVKKLKRDDVSKFALVNSSDRNTLIKAACSPSDRALYRLATEPVIEQMVTKFRTDHSDWRRAAFMLQRLGLQYKSKAKLVPTSTDHDVQPIQAAPTQKLPVIPLINKPSESAVIQRINLDKLAEKGADEIKIKCSKKGKRESKPTEDSAVPIWTKSESDPFFEPVTEVKCKKQNKQPVAVSGGMNRRQRRRKMDDVPEAEESKSKPTPKSVHPSWAAQRKQRDLQVNAKPSGKRIVFGDDC